MIPNGLRNRFIYILLDCIEAIFGIVPSQLQVFSASFSLFMQESLVCLAYSWLEAVFSMIQLCVEHLTITEQKHDR